ncbi:MAG: cytidylate kinase-like family protein [Bacteroidia bacterium]|nr:cytidylate kinase-like family protein [Bacteroidia bacterium]
MDKFLDYFGNREQGSDKSGHDEGPVITISRMTGCDARQVAEKVVESLNRKSGGTKWKWIDKGIIANIAKELDTSDERVENFFKGFELSNISEMLMAFSGGFVSDLRLKKAIKDVVLSFCKQGHIVLVGRGGASIAHDLPNSLHVKLTAPFYWRVKNVMQKKEMDIEAAEEYVVFNDEKRHNLITTFLERKIVNIDYLFDCIFDRSSYSIPETAEFIVNMYEKKLGKSSSDRTTKPKIF